MLVWKEENKWKEAKDGPFIFLKRHALFNQIQCLSQLLNENNNGIVSIAVAMQRSVVEFVVWSISHVNKP